jgi:hypothetical protein
VLGALSHIVFSPKVKSTMLSTKNSANLGSYLPFEIKRRLLKRLLLHYNNGMIIHNGMNIEARCNIEVPGQLG